ncbi:heavy-metal-associated domain-containing protein [Nocardioides marmotae]|uniref:Cation-transporting ATPase n=1 Tax=Nocardioides marmotae TaxID=2663857 RepID=A0A6I3JCE8_9ACTN|nr:heavy metal-associated domain-containing protein [Nocardioides marmotae]MCR6032151.1 cation-transporting ATPase [Gordonia jinghuaiqii]MBC9735370.1 heavy-metal-associated domain-containing protein [Nocardioides marmotae]MTB86470.1 cation-transporting ATPase [Nocardioides marmotae]MTB95797.1 cation-transporting ATPase [Nocardioides marmotae]QKE02846.1 heavy-metal-associated domain-containing protein [Nocardioides marmotae]
MSTSSTWTVTGMTCAHCEASVREEIGELAGVESVTADHTTGEVVVTSAEPLDRAAVASAVTEAGYELV